MRKPSVFISSTIYDFSVLRSALKYWLEEMGFNAQLSEYNDFQKDLTTNSYEACLKAVSECDYFVLLIGTRRGGLYLGENISITRKEYQVAYELAQTGKLKKLVVFIRQNVWDVKEDRKSLNKLLQDLEILENDRPVDKSLIKNYNSSILRDAEHITSFIDEVTRKKDSRSGKSPNMNWVHTFNTFEDIISALLVELCVTADVSVRIAEQNIKMALIHTLQKISYKTTSGIVTAIYLPFAEIREKLKVWRDNNNIYTGEETIKLSKEEVDKMSQLLISPSWGVAELTSYEYENALSSGIFMDYDIQRGTPVYNNFCRMLHRLVEEINRLKKLIPDFSPAPAGAMLENIRNYSKRDKQVYDFKFLDLALLSAIYERYINIQNISLYLIYCIKSQNNNLKLPTLLAGFVRNEHPLEEDILLIVDNDDYGQSN